MYKKMLFFIVCCLMSLSSFTYATTEDIHLSVYLGDTINLQTYLQNHNYDIVIDQDTNFQNANDRIINIDKENFDIYTRSIGETILIIDNNSVLTPIHITVNSTVKEIITPTDDLVLLLGEIYPLEYTIIYEDGHTGPSNEGLTWKASPVNIAGVKGPNKIYTLAVGQTTLTGTTADGGKSISIDVQVISNPNYLAIVPPIFDGTIKVGEQRQLKAYFGEKDVTNLVKWTSQYPEILTIDENGLVTPLKQGASSITAEPSIERRKKTYDFDVVSMIDGIKLDKTSVTLNKIGNHAHVQASLIYKNPEEKALLDGYYYESVNPEVATISEDGLITAVGHGITLVKAIAYDSGKWTGCTVEVTDNSNKVTTIDYTPVQKIELSPYGRTYLIGDKIPIDYKITPENATNQSVKFDLINEDVSQIHLIDDQYYFIPEKHDTFDIKIVAADGATDQVRLTVKSPLISMALDLSTNRNAAEKDKLYVGERAEVLTTFDTLGHYTSYDVYPSTLEYKIDDPSILKLESINGKHYVTALKTGTTYLRANNIAGRYDEQIKITVSNPSTKVTTVNKVEMPLNQFYLPDLTYKFKSSAENRDLDYLAQGVNFDIQTFYLEESYIDQEIAYEKQVIDFFKPLSLNPTVNANITRHRTRLNRLEILKNTASDSYCLLKNNNLKDRNFETYRYTSVENNRIAGHYPSKASVSIGLGHSAVTADVAFYWHDNNSNYATTPILNYELPSSIFSDLESATSKDELAYVAMYLEKYYDNVSSVDTRNVYYYDVTSELVKEALAKQYIKPISENYLGVVEAVSYDEFKALVDRIIPNNSLPVTGPDTLSHKKLIDFLSSL